MSSRFVSAGTIGSGSEVSKDEASEAKQQPPQPPQPQLAAKNAAWEAAQQELEAERRRREEARLKAAAGEEKSLYEILQANKAAKQAAFEEKTKLRNQFRALDADEAEFLDEVRARRRRDEDEVRRQTEEGLRAFRERQRRSSGDAPAPDDAPGADEWVPGRKRKRAARDRDVKGVRSSKAGDGAARHPDGERAAEPAKRSRPSALVDYGSDDGSDD